MAINPVSSLMGDDQESKGLGNELRERVNMNKQADIALHPPTAAPKGTAMKPVGTSPVDKVPSRGGPYGTGTGHGEKLIDTREMTKPLGAPKMHDGGTVQHSGLHNLQKGEKVLTGEQHGHLKAAMALAHNALSGPENNKPAKVVKEMHIRKTDNGGYIAKHIHASFEHPDEEHVHPHMDALHDHMEEHWGEPNEGEDASENEKDESPGVMAIQKAVGMEK